MRSQPIIGQLWVMAAILSVSTVVEGAEVYKVTVTRKSGDLYQIQGQKIFVKTRYCYEYVYGDEAILRIDSPGGYNVGKIIFSSGTSCDVEIILRG